jgi:serine/threonine protein kinase
LIAEGAFGRVFLGRSLPTGETVALTTRALPEPGQDERRAFRELECLAACAHPATVRLVGFSWTFSSETPLAIATAFLPNGDLSTALKAERQSQTPVLDATQKSKVIFGVVAGLAFLHGRGILHRDLRPEAVLLDGRFEPAIGGFGFSRFFDGGLNLTGAVGTPQFMAPELFADGEPYGFAVDVYSFAVTLYSIFADPQELDDGRGNAKTWPALMARVSEGARFARKAEIPDSQWEVIRACWAADPKVRPTFQSLLDSFRGGHRYVLDGADRAAVLEYESRVYGQFGPPNPDKPTF